MSSRWNILDSQSNSLPIDLLEDEQLNYCTDKTVTSK